MQHTLFPQRNLTICWQLLESSRRRTHSCRQYIALSSSKH